MYGEQHKDEIQLSKLLDQYDSCPKIHSIYMYSNFISLNVQVAPINKMTNLWIVVQQSQELTLKTWGKIRQRIYIVQEQAQQKFWLNQMQPVIILQL